MRSTSHPQDELLIIEALREFADQIDETNRIRAARARRLAVDVANEHGLDVSDALYQIQTYEEQISRSHRKLRTQYFHSDL